MACICFIAIFPMNMNHNSSILCTSLQLSLVFSYAACHAERATATAPEAQTNTRLHGGDLLDSAWLRPAHCECVLPVRCTSLQMIVADPSHAHPASQQLGIQCIFRFSCEATECSDSIPPVLVSRAAAVPATCCNGQLLSKIQKCNAAASEVCT